MTDGSRFSVAMLLQKVDNALTSIGKEGTETEFPTSMWSAPNGVTSNDETNKAYHNERVVYEYFIARRARSYFDYVIRHLKENNLELFNTLKLEPDTEPYDLFVGQFLALQAKISNGGKQLDKRKLASELRKAGVDQAVIDRCFDAAMTERSNRATIDASFK